MLRLREANFPSDTPPSRVEKPWATPPAASKPSQDR